MPRFNKLSSHSGMCRWLRGLLTSMAVMLSFAVSAHDQLWRTGPVAPDNIIPAIDTPVYYPDSTYEPRVLQPRRNLIEKVVHYFSESNREPAPGKLNITFLGGPSYSSSTSAELAVIAAGIYRKGPAETTQLSEMDVFAEGSVTGFYNVGVRGHHFLPNDRFLINYHGNFCHFPSKYWGVGYDMCSDNANESEYTLLQSLIRAEFLWHLPHDIYLGPSVCFNYSKAIKAENPAVWQGANMENIAYGVGFILSLDTRDVCENAHTGYYIKLHQRYFPHFMGNRKGCSITELTLSRYFQVWKSGVVALQFHGSGSTKHTPWNLLPTIDDSNAIRGYYEGRYRDRGELDGVIELRQHIWHRNGIVAWAGVGTVFHRFDQISRHHLLPSFGLGYRWEFKKNVNVRLDFGVGKHSSGFTIGLNESF